MPRQVHRWLGSGQGDCGCSLGEASDKQSYSNSLQAKDSREKRPRPAVGRQVQGDSVVRTAATRASLRLPVSPSMA
jgi:hypothetical protein